MSPPLNAAVFFLIIITGLAAGSFLGLCVYRLPRKSSVIGPFSKCPECGERIKPRDLIPIAGYILLKGKCRNCGARISPRYLIIEILNAFCWALALLRFGLSVSFLLSCLLLSTLIVIAFIDAEHKIIPDTAVVLIAFLAVINIFFASETPLLTHIIGAFAVSVLFLVIMLVSKGGMGGGDVKLMAAAGLYLGYKSVLIALAAGSVTGALAGMTLLARKRAGLKSEIPFGPYLALGIAAAALYGEPILSWYGRLLY